MDWEFFRFIEVSKKEGRGKKREGTGKENGTRPEKKKKKSGVLSGARNGF